MMTDRNCNMTMKKSPLQIHNEMYEKYRKDVERIANLTTDEVSKLAPQVTPFHKYKKIQKSTNE